MALNKDALIKLLESTHTAIESIIYGKILEPKKEEEKEYRYRKGVTEKSYHEVMKLAHKFIRELQESCDRLIVSAQNFHGPYRKKIGDIYYYFANASIERWTLLYENPELVKQLTSPSLFEDRVKLDKTTIWYDVDWDQMSAPFYYDKASLWYRFEKDKQECEVGKDQVHIHTEEVLKLVRESSLSMADKVKARSRAKTQPVAAKKSEEKQTTDPRLLFQSYHETKKMNIPMKSLFTPSFPASSSNGSGSGSGSTETNPIVKLLNEMAQAFENVLDFYDEPYKISCYDQYTFLSLGVITNNLEKLKKTDFDQKKSLDEGLALLDQTMYILIRFYGDIWFSFEENDDFVRSSAEKEQAFSFIRSCQQEDYNQRIAIYDLCFILDDLKQTLTSKKATLELASPRKDLKAKRSSREEKEDKAPPSTPKKEDKQKEASPTLSGKKRPLGEESKESDPKDSTKHQKIEPTSPSTPANGANLSVAEHSAGIKSDEASSPVAINAPPLPIFAANEGGSSSMVIGDDTTQPSLPQARV